MVNNVVLGFIVIGEWIGIGYVEIAGIGSLYNIINCYGDTGDVLACCRTDGALF
jgi:hypothetical protein